MRPAILALTLFALFAPAWAQGQKRWEPAAPPSSPAEMIAPGVISTGDVFGSGLSPDGNELVFVKAANKRKTMELWQSRRVKGQWQTPTRIAWSRDRDLDPFITPDNQRMIFNRRISVTPLNFDTYISDRQPDGSWGEPYPAPGQANTDSADVYSTTNAKGDLYFGSNWKGNRDIYVSRWDGKQYGAPVALPAPVNTDSVEANPFIDPQERYILFYRSAQSIAGVAKLMISFRNADGSWQPARVLPLPAQDGFCPYVTPDGKWLYFAHVIFDHSGPRPVVVQENLYRVRTKDLGLKLPR